jgi:hypothetical protein
MEKLDKKKGKRAGREGEKYVFRRMFNLFIPWPTSPLSCIGHSCQSEFQMIFNAPLGMHFSDTNLLSQIPYANFILYQAFALWGNFSPAVIIPGTGTRQVETDPILSSP